jgi:hypothetical protein
MTQGDFSGASAELVRRLSRGALSDSVEISAVDGDSGLSRGQDMLQFNPTSCEGEEAAEAELPGGITWRQRTREWKS